LDASDTLNRITVDINGDGLSDVLVRYRDPNPDPIEKQVSPTESGRLSWAAYVRVRDTNTYARSKGFTQNQEELALGQEGDSLLLNRELSHIGQIAEISRFGIVTAGFDHPREGPETTTIWAYTWEGDHFKRHKLAEYVSSQENAIFGKYLVEDKRTVLQVQQVTP
jgi:hypothetical protein